jgi:hypothetical protein
MKLGGRFTRQDILKNTVNGIRGKVHQTRNLKKVLQMKSEGRCTKTRNVKKYSR